MKFGTLHQTLNPESRDQKLHFFKFKMAVAAILKIALCVKFKMADGRHFENR